MHDTLKKPRELLAVSYAVRFPEFAAKSKHPAGEVDLDTMDAQVLFYLFLVFFTIRFLSSSFDSFNDCRWLRMTVNVSWPWNALSSKQLASTSLLEFLSHM